MRFEITIIYPQVVVVRERDLLRLVLPGGTRAKVIQLRDRMSAALAPRGLRTPPSTLTRGEDMGFL